VNGVSYNMFSMFEKDLKYSLEEQNTDLKSLYNTKNIGKYKNKIDLYSVGIILMLIYKFKIVKFPKLKISPLVDIIKSMICFDPKERPNIEDVVRDYHHMVVQQLM